MSEPQQMSKPLLIDTNRLKPIDDPELKNVECEVCHKPQARWGFLPFDDYEATGNDVASDMEGTEQLPHSLCSYCFLYESGWGLARVEDVKLYVSDLETELQMEMSKDENGRVTDIKQCDNMLGAIALFSRMFELRNAAMAEQIYKAQAEIEKSKGAEKSRIITLNDSIKTSGLILPAGGQFQKK
jgi:hypothetical protein